MKANEITNQPQGKVYVDMDGVLADFVAGVDKLMDKPYSEEKYKSDPAYRKEMWKLVADYSANGGKLWLELPMMSDAMELWNYVKKYNPEILSATGKPVHGADTQKHDWIRNHIGSNVKVNLVRQSKEKAQYAHPGDILIDDQRKSIDPWIKAGGTGILHKNAADTIKQLKALGY